jgi:hypothetical protein
MLKESVVLVDNSGYHNLLAKMFLNVIHIILENKVIRQILLISQYVVLQNKEPFTNY